MEGRAIAQFKVINRGPGVPASERDPSRETFPCPINCSPARRIAVDQSLWKPGCLGSSRHGSLFVMKEQAENRPMCPSRFRELRQGAREADTVERAGGDESIRFDGSRDGGSSSPRDQTGMSGNNPVTVTSNR